VVRPEHFVARPRQALWLAGGLLTVFVVLAALVPTGPLAIEARWSAWVVRRRTPALTNAALAINDLGLGWGRALTLTAIALPLLARRRWLALAALAFAETVTPLVTSLTKAILDRPRPTAGLVHAAGSAFPSGHAAYAATTCVAVVLLYTPPGRGRRWWWTLAALAIAAIALSRTYLHVHWLLDVIAATALGAGVAVATFAAAQIGAALWRVAPRVPATAAVDAKSTTGSGRDRE